MIDKTASLTPEVIHIVQDHGTEYPHTGHYNLTDQLGSYLCRRCGIALFRSTQKFISSCGWPSFDDEIPERIHRLTDADGRRTEIRCQRCDAHLGHVFMGEAYTAKNQRHCVNSAAIDFANSVEVDDSEEAIFAGGCFWGVEYLLAQQPGVLLTEVGYCGGHLDHPSYTDVCRGDTEHLEATRIVFDPKVISYEKLARFFFEIHNPTQADGQGPDIGPQYLSAIFVYDKQQQQTAEALIALLRENNFNVVTEIRPMAVFWPAEEKHQRYYEKTGHAPYCHRYQRRFD